MELVARAFPASEMNLSIVMSTVERKQSSIKDYDKLLQYQFLKEQIIYTTGLGLIWVTFLITF